MKIKKIDIDCEDNFKYTQIAFLVDREDFLADIERLRKKWLKSYTPISHSKYIQWYMDLDKVSFKSAEKAEKVIEGMRDDLVKAFIFLAEEKVKSAMPILQRKEKIERSVPVQDYQKDIEALCIKYHVPKTYRYVMEYAVICGLIKEKDWVSCEAILKPAGVKPAYGYERADGFIIENEEPEFVFKVTPYTTDKDISILLKKLLPEIRRLYKISRYGFRKYAKDTVSNIKRDRVWYWKHLPEDRGGEGKSYMQIAKIAKQENPKVNILTFKESVRKQIKQYEYNLKKPI